MAAQMYNIASKVSRITIYLLLMEQSTQGLLNTGLFPFHNFEGEWLPLAVKVHSKDLHLPIAASSICHIRFSCLSVEISQILCRAAGAGIKSTHNAAEVDHRNEIRMMNTSDAVPASFLCFLLKRTSKEVVESGVTWEHVGKLFNCTEPHQSCDCICH
jgi:hypothetical protein